MGFFLVGIGFLVNIVCGIWILIMAFRVSVGWGLAVMFLPFAGLFFVINHWNDTKKPFLGGIASGVLIVMGLFLVPTPDPDADAAERRRATPRNTASTASEDEDAPVNYASAAAPATNYQPRTTAYQPVPYTPSYAPLQQSAPPPTTDTQAAEDEWSRKPKFEQVYVDRDTNLFYTDKCKKRPENVYRIPKSVALMQGFEEAKCR